ncbi:general odorant-binding protein 83a-like [Athalia rosae]|uniref:general odorant-binding protein 83a-like n=1 Tax=Athalia rosae TaxID=37344 RepID=UPI002034799B|nr:general odorant-binding protein 83a-like [Athalia rosae]
MKAYVLLLTLAFAACLVDVESRMTAKQINNALKTVARACIAKTGVTKDVVAASHNGEFPEDRNLMCFLNCAMNMMQTSRDGRFSQEAADAQTEAMLPEELVDRTKAMTAHCVTKITSDDPCEGSWQYAKCNYETDKEVYFFP